MTDDIKQLAEAIGPFTRRVADKLERIVARVREMRRDNLERAEDEMGHRAYLNGELADLEEMAAHAATLVGWVDNQVKEGDTGPLSALAAALREAEDDG